MATEIGSPRGATFSTLIISPGTQPISINFKKISSFSKEWILTIEPTDKSDNRFINKWINKISFTGKITLTILEKWQTGLKKKYIFIFRRWLLIYRIECG